MSSDIQDHPQSLLPFYVNGSLSLEQQTEIELHLQVCDHCREEIHFLNKLRQQVKRSTIAAGPGELGLRRLLRDVKRDQSRVIVLRWWKPAMTAAVLVIVLQSVLLLRPQPAQQTYAPLGVQQTGIQIIFQPTATEVQIRKVLNQVHARIIDGPSALGVYQIELLDKQLTSRQREATIARLRSQTIVQDVSP